MFDLGVFVGALLITGALSALVLKFWPRPWPAALTVGAVGTGLSFWGSDGHFTLAYLVAAVIWGWVFHARAAKAAARNVAPPAV